MTIADRVNFSDRFFPSEWNIPEDLTGRILVGGLSGWKDECYYLVDFDRRIIRNCTIDISSYVDDMARYLEQRVSVPKLPYASTSHRAAVFNFVQPHEGMALKDGRIIFATHNASYAREIEFDQGHVSQFSEQPRFVPQMMSATNSLDKAGDRMFYAVTDMDQRVRMYVNGPGELDTSVYSVDTQWRKSEKIADIKTQEVIHEVKCCPNERFLALTEFCLTARGRFPDFSETVFKDYHLWNDYESKGLYTSSLYLVDRSAGTWSSRPVNDQTPGHIEFSNTDPDRFYLSSHNLSKLHGKLILHGRGSLITGSIASGVLSLTGGYSDPVFYRVTSHKVFSFEGEHFIAVTVYPNRFYILSEPDLRVVHDIKLYEHEAIGAAGLYFCNMQPHLPLWIETSDNGRYVILISNEYVYFYDMKTRNLESLQGYSFNGGFIGTAHITNMNDFTVLN